MLTKYASTAVLDARLAPKSGGLVRDAHRHEFAYEPREGFLYVRSRAISSRINDNFDAFPAEEIKKAYRTFIGKPVFVNHHNDDHRRARGVIVDAALHEDINPDGSPDTWAEVLMEVDAVRFPKLAKAILAGEIDRTSMGTQVAFSVCSACGNKATNPTEYCFPPGQLVSMADGTYRPIETITPGDRVLTHDGIGVVSALGERHYQGDIVSVWRTGSSYPMRLTDGHGVLANTFGGRDDRARSDSRYASVHSVENWEKTPAGDLLPGHWVQGTYTSETEPFLIDVATLAPDFVEIGGRVILATPTTSGSKRQLTLDQANEIRLRRGVGESGSDLSREFGVSQATVSNILHGKAYADAPLPRMAWTSSSLSRWIEPTDPLAVLLGYYLAEGSVEGFSPAGTAKTVTWSLHGSEEWIADEIETALEKMDAGSLKRYRPSENRLIAKVSNAPLAALLIHLAGRTTATSRGKKVLSREAMTAPLDFQQRMLTAYCKGDGWDATEFHCEIRTASDLLARQLVTLGARLYEHIPTVFRNLNNPGGPGDRSKKSTINHVAVRSESGSMNGRRRLGENYYAAKITKVEREEYHGPVYNITVDHQHTYAVEDMVVFNCDHIPRLKGKKIRRVTASGTKEDTLVYETCFGLGFFENSLLVEQPADPTAYTLGVDARGLGMQAVASRRTALDEVMAPAKVDTLRDTSCPVCSENDSYDGDKCLVCGFIRPPDEFMDPDLEKAKQVDLRQEQEDAAATTQDGAPNPDPAQAGTGEDGADPTHPWLNREMLADPDSAPSTGKPWEQHEIGADAVSDSVSAEGDTTNKPWLSKTLPKTSAALATK